MCLIRHHRRAGCCRKFLPSLACAAFLSVPRCLSVSVSLSLCLCLCFSVDEKVVEGRFVISGLRRAPACRVCLLCLPAHSVFLFVFLSVSIHLHIGLTSGEHTHTHTQLVDFAREADVIVITTGGCQNYIGHTGASCQAWCVCVCVSECVCVQRESEREREREREREGERETSGTQRHHARLAQSVVCVSVRKRECTESGKVRDNGYTGASCQA